MLRFIAAFVLLSIVTACAQLTGDPVNDCLAARNGVIKAQGYATASAALAAAKPKSDEYAAAAALAQANLANAMSLQAAVCPVAPVPVTIIPAN